MQELVNVTGMILKAEPIGEYDRRVVILTGERGKIAAFAKGARKQGSRLLAATTPFCFGQFKLFEGRSAYTIGEAQINNYFEGLREDFVNAYYGMYFLEVMDYYTRENNDERQMLNLLYQSLKALQHLSVSGSRSMSPKLIRYIFEIKALVQNGEYPGIPQDKAWEESTVYTMNFIAGTQIGKLYTFTVTDKVLAEIEEIADGFRRRFIDRNFKSLEILRTIL